MVATYVLSRCYNGLCAGLFRWFIFRQRSLNSISGNAMNKIASRMNTHSIKYDLNHQTAAWTDSNIFAIAQIIDGDLEPISTRTRVVVDLEGGVVSHVFDLDLVVVRHLNSYKILP